MRVEVKKQQAASDPSWAHCVCELLAAYRAADRESLSLPPLGSVEGGVTSFSPWQSLGYMRAAIATIRTAWSSESSNPVVDKPVLMMLEDLGFVGVWRGEASLVGGMTSRPLVSSLLAAHFRRRLSLLRRWISLGTATDDDGDDDLLRQIDAALGTWKARRSIGGAVTFVVSVLGTVGGLVGVANGVAEVPWYGWLGLGFAVYALYLFVVRSFVVKRAVENPRKRPIRT
jgi:hypothetical protein